MEQYEDTIRHNSQGEPKVTFGLMMSYKLWHYLVGNQHIVNSHHRYSKVEAFFDLLDRQRKSISTEDDGYMDSSIMKLADSWGWMRPTAKKFLDKLADLGAVTLTSAGNRIVVRLNNILGEDTLVSQSSNISMNNPVGSPTGTLSGDAVNLPP